MRKVFVHLREALVHLIERERCDSIPVYWIGGQIIPQGWCDSMKRIQVFLVMVLMLGLVFSLSGCDRGDGDGSPFPAAADPSAFTGLLTRDLPEDLPPANELAFEGGVTGTAIDASDMNVIQLRKKLGLYIREIQDGSNNHNVNMIIGNQATGRWMKRSPFENPYVLADQIGN